MAEVLNTNVFDVNKKFVDFAGLDYFWEKAKKYVDDIDKAIDDKVVALADVVGDSSKGLVQKVNLIQDELDGLNGGAGSITTQIENAIAALDLANTYETKGDAAKAEAAAKAYVDGVVGTLPVVDDETLTVAEAIEAAKTYADGLDGLMDARVDALEAIDHAKLASDASAAAVATILDGAPEKFDTLKEVAQWIADSESAATAADLVNRVKGLEDHKDDYVTADTALETSLKGYADQAKADAEAAAKAYTDAELVKVNAVIEENERVTAEALTDLDGRVATIEAQDVYVAVDVTSAIATAKTEAITKAVEDAAAMLASYYTKSEVDGLLSSADTAAQGYATAAQGAAEAYAKTYTDALFNSFKFAQNSDIDALFAPKAE